MKRVKKDMKQIMAAIIELFCFCATVTNTCHWFGLHKLALNVIIIARRVTFLLWCTKRKKNTFFEQKIKRESIDTKFGLNIVSYFWLFLCALTFRLIQKSLIHLITVRMHEYSPTIQFMFCDLCGSFLFKLVWFLFVCVFLVFLSHSFNWSVVINACYFNGFLLLFFLLFFK